jgi:hypothetical protein
MGCDPSAINYAFLEMWFFLSQDNDCVVIHCISSEMMFYPRWVKDSFCLETDYVSLVKN